MYTWAVLSTLLLSQSLQPADSWAIRQLGGDGDGDGIMASIMPLISAIASIPTSALRASLNLTGTNRANAGSTLTSFTSSSSGFGGGGGGGTGLTTGAAIGQQGNTVGNGGVAIIRRGSELLADQLVAALGGAATLLDMLESYEQSGQVYLGNVQTSVQGLTSRLMNTAYNGANVMIQELSNQAASSPSGGDFFLRRSGGGGGGLSIASTRPVTARPFVLTTAQTVPPRDGFGFASDINGQTLADVGGGRNMVSEELSTASRETGTAATVDGLSSVVASAASPFGTSSENFSADGTIGSLASGGRRAFSSDFFSAPAPPAPSTGDFIAPTPLAVISDAA